MNYQARWRLAVALKQPYPTISDTGATPPPPQFTAEELAPAVEAEQRRKVDPRQWFFGGLLGFFVGAGVAIVVTHRDD